MEKNKRLFERFKARFPVKFEHSQGDFGKDVFLRDASAQGMKFTTRQRLFLHDGVAVEVKLPDGNDPLKLNGRVKWTRLSGPDLWDVGVEFHKIDLMKVQRIFKWVSPS